MHFPALGNPPDNRAAFRSGEPAARRRYLDILASPEGQTALDTLLDLASSDVVAVLCFEADHNTCHRACVIDAVEARLSVRDIV